MGIDVKKFLWLTFFFTLEIISKGETLSQPSRANSNQSLSAISQIGSAVNLDAIPASKEIVSVIAVGRPIGSVLRDLSQKLSVDLTATPQVGNQRVTLSLDSQSLSHVMLRLTELLCHSSATPYGYHWEEITPNGIPRKMYRLWRDRRSLEQEQEMLDYPRRKAAHLLREFRNISNLTPIQLARYKTELPYDYVTDEAFQPFRTALKGLSDAQIDALVQGKSVPIDPEPFGGQIAAYNKQWRESALRQHDNALSNGQRDPFPNGVPEVPLLPPSLRFEADDYGGDHPERSILYGLFLEGLSLFQGGQMHAVFSPLEDDSTPFPETTSSSEPILDLTPILTKKSVTSEQKGNIGFALQALASVAKIELYEENFYKTIYWGAKSNGLKTLKGTLPQLINAICKEWGYQAQKVEHDYLFWSKTWAQDRAADVPEYLITRWEQRLKKQGHFTLDDRIEMATRLNWSQIRLTLNLRLPASGDWESRREVSALHFLGTLSPGEHSRVMSDAGLALNSLSSQQQQEFVNNLLKMVSPLNADQLSTARIFVVSERLPQSHKENRIALVGKLANGVPFLTFWFASYTPPPE